MKLNHVKFLIDAINFDHIEIVPIYVYRYMFDSAAFWVFIVQNELSFEMESIYHDITCFVCVIKQTLTYIRNEGEKSRSESVIEERNKDTEI